jgi:hypothetical protein
MQLETRTPKSQRLDLWFLVLQIYQIDIAFRYSSCEAIEFELPFLLLLYCTLITS